MELHERIKDIRKNYLHLSQEAFGARVGVSRSVINNIERNALARPEQKISLIKLICKEFSINENWLLNGIEPMFVEQETFSLANFAKQYNATDLEINIIKAYFEFDPEIRKTLIQHFKERLSADNTKSNEMTVEEAEAAYIKSRSIHAQKKDLSASSTGTDTKKERAAND